MCLISSKKFQYTTKDIPVFKVVGLFNTSIPRGYKLSPKNRNNEVPEIQTYIKNSYVFEGGFFYAFLTEKAANEFINTILDNQTKKNSRIITGYVPVNTWYAFDENRGMICARKLNLDI